MIDPFDFAQGKRSISDHMNEAVNYIKHLNVRIHKLNDQKDKLKKFSNSASFNSGSGDSSTCSRKCMVEINHLFDGTEVEIIISRGSKEEGEDIPLSSVLQFLLERGLDVVNCFSTKVNERTLHKIHCEVCPHHINLYVIFCFNGSYLPSWSILFGRLPVILNTWI